MAMFNIKGMKYDNEGFQQMTASAVSYFLFSYMSSPIFLPFLLLCIPHTQGPSKLLVRSLLKISSLLPK